MYANAVCGCHHRSHSPSQLIADLIRNGHPSTPQPVAKLPMLAAVFGYVERHCTTPHLPECVPRNYSKLDIVRKTARRGRRN